MPAFHIALLLELFRLPEFPSPIAIGGVPGAEAADDRRIAMERTADCFEACPTHSRPKYTNTARGFTHLLCGPAELNPVHSRRTHEPLDEPALKALRLTAVT